jgi:hypothetical protein
MRSRVKPGRKKIDPDATRANLVKVDAAGRGFLRRTPVVFQPIFEKRAKFRA